MSIQVYNTLTKSKETFSSIDDSHVKMYVCGPTVYDLLHVGNFRGAIFFNLVRNWLEFSGYKVTFVYNYTDVDDKIIKKAKEEGVSPSDIAEKYINEFEVDFSRLGLTKHSHNPKVTDFMPEIISYVETLVKKNKAYVVEGEVFYSIESFDNYCELSGKNLDDLNAGQRVEVDKRKKSPYDFVLWKPSKMGEPSWDSPWGAGRPGWHIECSAMIKSLLGDTIDIHGGGIDLIFPHHENEIAQGEGCNCQKYCNYWMHNEFINLKDQKMSKSLGNVITGRSFMDQYHPEVLKFLMLSAHYRSVLSFTDEKVHQAISGLRRIYDSLKVANLIVDNFTDASEGKVQKSFAAKLKEFDFKISKAFNDDFNTGEVLASLFEAVRTFNGLNLLKKEKDPNSSSTALFFKTWLIKYGDLMALFNGSPNEILSELDEILIREKNIDTDKVEKLLKEREEARQKSDWESADKFRDQLHAMGIEFQESSEGVSWFVKV